MSAVTAVRAKPNARSVVQLACASVSGWFLSKYLNIDAEIAVWLTSVLLQCWAVSVLRGNRPLGKGALFILGVFSALFTFSLVLGEHIVVGDRYIGLVAENYITSYTLIDLLAFIAILPGVFVMLAAPVSYASNRVDRTVAMGGAPNYPAGFSRR